MNLGIDDDDRWCSRYILTYSVPLVAPMRDYMLRMHLCIFIIKKKLILFDKYLSHKLNFGTKRY